ncbi:MAG: cytochrome P460 family protein [Thermodesulfovibrionales bacterium]
MHGTMKALSVILLAAIALFLISAESSSAGDRYDLTAPNGIAFSEIRGFEKWQVIAPSYRTDKKEVRFILGNQTAVQAFTDGAPEKTPFPDGTIMVKVAHSEKELSEYPSAFVPDVLQRIELIMKDSKRFPETKGWGYARFVYNPKADGFTAYGKDTSFVQECFQCHTLVSGKDYVFTRYAPR